MFGKPKSNTDFVPYDGPGFKLSIPAKWNPSKEVEFPGQVLRYEDNFDTTSNLSVMVTPTDKKSITDYGSPEEFLSKVIYKRALQLSKNEIDLHCIILSVSGGLLAWETSLLRENRI